MKCWQVVVWTVLINYLFTIWDGMRPPNNVFYTRTCDCCLISSKQQEFRYIHDDNKFTTLVSSYKQWNQHIGKIKMGSKLQCFIMGLCVTGWHYVLTKIENGILSLSLYEKQSRLRAYNLIAPLRLYS